MSSREEKNMMIREKGKATRLKRQSQTCRTFRFKIDKSSLKKEQLETLKMFFIETKRVYNYLLNKINTGEDLFSYDYRNLYNITYLDKDKNTIDYKISYIGSSILQDQVRLMKEAIIALSVKKNRGRKVGRLRFKSECNSIRLYQYGLTHQIRGSKFKIQGIKDPIRVTGLKQLNKYDNIDYTTANLLYDGVDYYISLTCFVDKEEKTLKDEIIGVDMGCSTTITLSNGLKMKASVEESDRLKKLQSVIERKTKRSNNWYKVRCKIRKEYNRMNNKKEDMSNKIVSNLLKYKTIIIQDELLIKWHQNELCSKTVQHSILGRTKSKLISHKDQVYILDSSLPTTQHCFYCGSDTKHEPSKRTFICSVCGYKEDRDIHAAKNMIQFYNIKNNPLGTNGYKPKQKELKILS